MAKMVMIHMPHVFAYGGWRLGVPMDTDAMDRAQAKSMDGYDDPANADPWVPGEYLVECGIADYGAERDETERAQNFGDYIFVMVSEGDVSKCTTRVDESVVPEVEKMNRRHWLAHAHEDGNADAFFDGESTAADAARRSDVKRVLIQAAARGLDPIAAEKIRQRNDLPRDGVERDRADGGIHDAATKWAMRAMNIDEPTAREMVKQRMAQMEIENVRVDR